MRDEILNIEVLPATKVDGCPVCEENDLTFTLIECNIGSVSKYQGYLWRGHCKKCRKTTVLIPKR